MKMMSVYDDLPHCKPVYEPSVLLRAVGCHTLPRTRAQSQPTAARLIELMLADPSVDVNAVGYGLPVAVDVWTFAHADRTTKIVLDKLLLARADLDLSLLQDRHDIVASVIYHYPHDAELMTAFLAHPNLCRQHPKHDAVELLHLCMTCERVSGVELLLERGTNVNTRSHYG